MRSSRPRLALLMPLAVLAVLLEPAAAGAHIRTGQVAVDYRANVLPLNSPLAGAVVVRIYAGDLAIGLTVQPHHRVAVLGYLGEPFLRIGVTGVEVNESSSTAAGMGLLKGAPATGGGSGWLLRSSGQSFIWHDTRVRGRPRGVERRRWTVPLVVDGRHARVEGEIWRVSAPSPWPWLVSGALFFASTLLLAASRKALLRAATVALGALTAAATILIEAGFAFAPSGSIGTWVEGANVLVFVSAGAAFLVLGSSDARALAGGALGLLGLSVGMSKLPVLRHGVVLSAFPDLVVRSAVVLAIAAGAAAAAVGLIVFFDILEHYEDPRGRERSL